MAEKDVPFDACVRPNELSNLAQACERVPEATVIINHVGNITDRRTLDDSADIIYRLISGYPTDDEAFVSNLLNLVQSAFSSKRLLYASNWPVISMYSNLDSHLSILLDRFAGDDDFFINNARNAYHITERKTP